MGPPTYYKIVSVVLVASAVARAWAPSFWMLLQLRLWGRRMRGVRKKENKRSHS